MLLAIFYARFHPSRGPSIIHKYPSDFVIASRSEDPSLKVQIPWGEISSYIIPPYELCNRPLSVRNNGYNILGLPVSLERDRYPRNRFTFNVCFVLSETDDVAPWEPLVRKTSQFFTALEEEDAILLAEEHVKDVKWPGGEGYPAVGSGVVYSLLESILEDINAYGEACVRLDDLHVLNLRLFRSGKAAPPKVNAWEVPLLVRPLPKPEEWTWDLTLERIFPHINGVNHIQRIAELADVEPKLVREAVRELVYHDRVLLLDIFHFHAIYMLTESFAIFAKDETLQDECANYVAIDSSTNPLAPPSAQTSPLPESMQPPTTAKQTLLSLYRALNAGQTVHNFVLTHQTNLEKIDIRRLITFGILKGFVRRLHRFALAVQSSTTASQQHSPGGAGGGSGNLSMINGGVATAAAAKSSADAREEFDRAWRKAAMSSGWETPPSEPPPTVGGAVGDRGGGDGESAIGDVRPDGEGMDLNKDSVREGLDDEKLRKYLDGRHCLDQICVELHMSEKKVVERLMNGRFGEVVFFCK